MTENNNEDVGYEKFAQEVYQSLLDNDEIKSTKVLHNVDLEGRSGCKHQIDVYWEYEIAGVLHRVAIECKSYNTNDISIGRIRDFFGALTDIGNINGIFVCKRRYQSGAIRFANHYGIVLKELRVPNESDWQGRVETIQINLSSVHKKIKSRLPILDTDWFDKHYAKPSGDRSFSIKGDEDKIFVTDKDGKPITSLFDLGNELPHNFKEEKDIEHEYRWDDAYLQVPDLGAVKITSMKFIYDVEVSDPDQIIISGKEMAKAILKDVRTGAIKFFYKNGMVK